MSDSEAHEDGIVTPQPLRNNRKISEIVAKGLLGTVPIAGGLLTELFQIAVSSGRQARMEKWVKDITDAVNQLVLKPRGLTFEALTEDDGFLDAIGVATRAAVETADAVKLGALRNAVLNSAFQLDLTADRRAILMDILVGLTPSHIKVLELFDDPREWLSKQGIHPEPSPMGGSANFVVQQAYPDLAQDRVLLDHLVRDLKNSGLADINLRAMMTSDGIFQSRTLELGKELLLYIAEPLVEV